MLIEIKFIETWKPFSCSIFGCIKNLSWNVQTTSDFDLMERGSCCRCKFNWILFSWIHFLKKKKTNWYSKAHFLFRCCSCLFTGGKLFGFKVREEKVGWFFSSIFYSFHLNSLMTKLRHHKCKINFLSKWFSCFMHPHTFFNQTCQDRSR